VISFPVVVCAIGSVSSFSCSYKLRHFKVSEKPPASHAKLSREQRQHKIQIASWIIFGNGCLMLAGGLLLNWMARSH
jgi:hypothetical protein